MPERRTESVTFTVVVTVAVVLGALLMLAVLALSGAPGVMLVAALLAALPVGPLLACYLWLDRYEPEPKPLLAYGLLWGAFVATAAALVLGGVGGVFVPVTDELSLAVVAPVTEEAAKGLFLLLLLWWRRAELDGILDGIVYAGMVGIGFAFTENILYLAAAYNGTDGMGPGGIAGVTSTFVVRCLVSPFAHPLFTAFIGIGVGVAVASRRRGVRIAAPAAGYVVAVLTHALWNGSTVFGAEGFAGVYVVLMVPALVGMICLAVWARRTEAVVLRAALDDAARRNLIPATDIGWVVDLGARRAARVHAARYGGPHGARAMADYQQATIELGYLHHRLLRGTPPDDWRERGAVHVERIRAVRPHIAFPGQVVPTL
ncbi:PrsW family intramembrane metalloprotease [Nocardioides sp.]|uniref:PrsW family intramembrane metalloprotease n=1 Tax=Nocardioides sp. TaxID=35761 RepID=UPI000C89D8DD|nr:PrsW family intramembrane metalloprotease [Nocardioides sp.]MAS53294.1 PrsW family intramembrane metalloprotease [Pimelobacter sp.]MDE0777081.1 PrsW family intramembrane metalloprotease [Nocardioides sp.]